MKASTLAVLLAAALVFSGAAGFIGAGKIPPATPSPEPSVHETVHAQGTVTELDALPTPQSHVPPTLVQNIEPTAFPALPESNQFASLEALLVSGTDADIQKFADLVQSISDSEQRARLLLCMDQFSREDGVEVIASFLRITEDLAIVEAVNRTIERAAQPETAVYLAEMASESGRSGFQRLQALDALGLIRNPAATEGLKQVVTDFPDEDTSAAAIGSLGKMQTPDAVSALSALFDRLPPERFAARHAVIEALGVSSSAETWALLQDLAEHHDQPLVRQAAQEALESWQG